MSIPTPDKVVGQTGHTADHNAISEVLTDHADRIDALEGGGGLPDPTGNAGAVLGTDGTDPAWVRSIVSADGATKVSAEDDQAYLYAADGLGAESKVRANPDGTVEINATGAVTVTGPTTFLSQEGSGRTTLNGEDFQGERADNSIPEATTARVTTRMRGTLDTPAAVVDGDTLDYPLYAQGHDGTDPVLAATITAEVDGTVATGKVPARVRIATADADGVLTDRMIIGADGTTDVLGDFTVNGSPVSGGGGGGLVLIDSGTFSAASGVNVDGVFDGTYDNYRLLIAPLDHSTSSQIRMQFRAAGSTISGSNYDTQYFYAFGTSAAPGTDDGSASFNIATLASDGVISFDIFQPAVARKTVMTGLRFSYQGDTSDFVLTSSGWVHHLTTAYDGFRLFPTSGTFTGSWALYGYAK